MPRTGKKASVTISRKKAAELYPQRTRRTRGPKALDAAGIDSLPEIARQAVIDAIGGRRNVRAYITEDNLPRKFSVLISNR